MTASAAERVHRDHVWMLRAADGRPAWHTTTSGPYAAAHVWRSTVVLADSEGPAGHDLETGARRWSVAVGNADSYNMLADAATLLVVALAENRDNARLLCLDPESGVRRWEKGLDLSEARYTHPITAITDDPARDMIWLSQPRARISALRRSTGDLLAQYRLEQPAIGMYVISPDGLLVVTETEAAYLTVPALARRWSKPLQWWQAVNYALEPNSRLPGMVRDGRFYYASTTERALACLDGQTGALLWRSELDPQHRAGTAGWHAGYLVYPARVDDQTAAICWHDASSGALAGRLETPALAGSILTKFGVGESGVYVAAHDHIDCYAWTPRESD